MISHFLQRFEYQLIRWLVKILFFLIGEYLFSILGLFQFVDLSVSDIINVVWIQAIAGFEHIQLSILQALFLNDGCRMDFILCFNLMHGIILDDVKSERAYGTVLF